MQHNENPCTQAEELLCLFSLIMKLGFSATKEIDQLRFPSFQIANLKPESKFLYFKSSIFVLFYIN